MSELASAKSSPSSAELFDLKKTILFAAEHSPSFDSSRRALKVAELEEKSAGAYLAPSVDLKVTHGILDSAPRLGRNPLNSEFDLGLTESLFDNGISETGSKIATLKRKEAQLRFEDQKNKLSLEIASTYLTYSLNEKLKEIQEKQYNFLKKKYESISKDYYQGVKLKKDFVRFKTQVSRGEISLFNAYNEAERSKGELMRLIGANLALGSRIEFVPIAIEAIKNEPYDFKLDVENHPQYLAAQLQKEANSLSADMILKKNLPEWLLSAGINYASSDYLGPGKSFSDVDKTNWYALLTVKYNIYDGGIRSRNSEAAIQKQSIQNNELDSELLLLGSTLSQLRLQFYQSQKTYGLAKELLELEKDSISYIEREYQNGKVNYLELTNGLESLSDAEIKFYSASAEQQNLKYTLLYHQGLLYEEIIK